MVNCNKNYIELMSYSHRTAIHFSEDSMTLKAPTVAFTKSF